VIVFDVTFAMGYTMGMKEDVLYVPMEQTNPAAASPVAKPIGLK
jgi:hypothetical protein